MAVIMELTLPTLDHTQFSGHGDLTLELQYDFIFAKFRGGHLLTRRLK
jgi:hypothetical protein